MWISSLSGFVSDNVLQGPVLSARSLNDWEDWQYNIIDTDYTIESMSKGIVKAMSDEFNKSISNMDYEFGDGSSSKIAIDALKSININQQLIRKK